MRAYEGKRIGNRINALLNALDVRESEFARKHGFHQAHLNRVKNGEIEPTGHVMLRIAAALGKPVGEVFWLEDA